MSSISYALDWPNSGYIYTSLGAQPSLVSFGNLDVKSLNISKCYDRSEKPDSVGYYKEGVPDITIGSNKYVLDKNATYPEIRIYFSEPGCLLDVNLSNVTKITIPYSNGYIDFTINIYPDSFSIWRTGHSNGKTFRSIR